MGFLSSSFHPKVENYLNYNGRKGETESVWNILVPQSKRAINILVFDVNFKGFLFSF